jgi:thioredoxin reductase (NADPH)
MNSQIIETDAVVIGSGPVGLFSVFELGLLDIKCEVVDILDKPGGQCAELYPDKPIYDIPGMPVVMGNELVELLIKQINPFKPNFHLSSMIDELEREGENLWKTKTDTGITFLSKVVVIAAGGGSFQPKKPPIKGISEYENKSVFYSIRDRKKFKGKNIVIIGGGDSALDWAITLNDDADSTTLIHRREEFRAAPETVNKVSSLISENKIKFHLGQVKSLNGKDGVLDNVVCSQGDNEIKIDCDTILPFFGLTMKLGPVANWGINLNENLVSVDTEKFETDQKGIFAIGDINTYPGKLKLILCGFHEAALMAQKAHSYVYPDKKITFQYTTSSTDLRKKLGVL